MLAGVILGTPPPTHTHTPVLAKTQQHWAQAHLPSSLRSRSRWPGCSLRFYQHQRMSYEELGLDEHRQCLPPASGLLGESLVKNQLGNGNWLDIYSPR